MRRSTLALGCLAGLAALLVIGERQAHACGGCFTPPSQTASDITDERMLLATSPTQTTLYDQIQYSGNPASFAWVLPIHGTVTVGLSADVLFDSFDALTVTTIVQPPSSCPPPPYCGGENAEAPGAGGGFGSADSGIAAEDAGVIVTKQQNVGPYDTVQLQSTSPTALQNWLAQNNFEIPAAVQATLGAYVTEGFNFLAMKLLPGQGVQAMRPVRVTSTGASLSLPLRMASIGTGNTVGITIWVVSDGRYEPQNFPFFHIDDAELVWDWSTSSSNYTTLRQQHETALKGKGWEIESSLSIAQLSVTNTVESGGVVDNGFGGPVTPSDASQDYLPVTDANGNVTETADQVRTDDINALFAGLTGPNTTVTRIRSDISHAAMTTDFVLQASADQSELSNIRNVTKSINEQCPIYGGSCNVVGYGTPAQASAAMSGMGMTGTGPAGGGALPATGSGGSGRGSGCNATAAPPLGGPVLFGSLGALVGLAMIRSRRRRP